MALALNTIIGHSWTLAVLPDTQYYSRSCPEVFLRQTEWIRTNREKYNIQFVAHLGDLTYDNGKEQWDRAKVPMDLLHEAGIPYSVLPGNHDYGEKGQSECRVTRLNEFFTEKDYRHSGSFRLFESNRVVNSWHEFSTDDEDHLIISLEFGPRKAVLDSANKIVADRPDRKTIVVTHAYLFADDTRYHWETGVLT